MIGLSNRLGEAQMKRLAFVELTAVTAPNLIVVVVRIQPRHFDQIAEFQLRTARRGVCDGLAPKARM